MEKLVSIITPTYNRRDYLIEAIESVLNQTYENFEMIVVDDGSTDTTCKTVKEKYTDQRIKLVSQRNQGQSSARNKGMSIAAGDFIGFLDSDNRWIKDKLEKQMSIFDSHPEIDVVYGKNNIIDKNGKFVSEQNYKGFTGNITYHLLLGNFVTLNTALIRSACLHSIGGFNELNRLNEDYELWLKLSVNHLFYYLPSVLAEYRTAGEDRISCNYETRLHADESLITQFMDSYPDLVNNKERNRVLSVFYENWGLYDRYNNRFLDSYKKYAKAIQLDFLRQGPYVGLAKAFISNLLSGEKK